MRNGPSKESAMGMSAKVVSGGILAVLGLVVLKFIIGVTVAITGIFVFFLVRVVPILLIGMVVIWLFRKLFRKDRTVTAAS
jgi:archaellum biogenesis protein FlaJ (TadC family)